MHLYKEIVLRPGKEESIKRFHPWIFSGAIASLPEGLKEGDTVRLLSSDRTFLGVGHYQPSSIAVRIMSFQDQRVDASYYRQQISTAYALRRRLRLIRDDNTIYRLVHGEGDGLPGLIIDMYGVTAVVQAHSAGIHFDRELIVQALQEVYPPEKLKHIYYKSEGTLPFKANIEDTDGYLFGGKEREETALENGFRFRIDWEKGQKTGFFIDQRESRLLLEQYASGCTVLNMFSYTGGFSAYALRGGAIAVDSVDSSSKALSIGEENVALNFGKDTRHASHAEDAFKFLREVPDGKYDLMVLDPPAFAKRRGATRNALQGYKKLNLAAMNKIASGGVLFTFSCSQALTRDQFRMAVFSAAAISGRNVRLLHQLTQPADHPISMYHPEGEYLKGLVLYID